MLRFRWPFYWEKRDERRMYWEGEVVDFGYPKVQREWIAARLARCGIFSFDIEERAL